MFDRIKKAFSRPPAGSEPSADGGEAAADHNRISEWAQTQGWGFVEQGGGRKFALEGSVLGRPWRLEQGRPSREFIHGEELRVRAELGIDDDVSILVMNRPLKEALEKKAYGIFTDSLQTTADPRLPEELRWLTMFPEVGWESLPNLFWSRYAVLSDDRDNALAWLDMALAEQLMDWPHPAHNAQVPFMLMLMRGKAYLRMEYNPPEMPVLQHATRVFTLACEKAIIAPLSGRG